MKPKNIGILISSSPNVSVGDLGQIPSFLDSRLKHAGMTVVLIGALLFISAKIFAAEPIWVSQFESVKQETRLNRRPRLDASGNLIVFESMISSEKRKAPRRKEAYLYNRTTRVLKKITGAAPELLNGEPFISGNGEVIAFQAYSPSTLPSLPPPKADIYLYFPRTDQYRLVTPGWNNGIQDGECSNPYLSFDGSKMAFSSNATNLSSTTVESLSRIYLLDFNDNSLRMMSINAQGQPANRLSGAPLLTQQNNVLFYKSAATNLLPNYPAADLSFHLYEMDPTFNTLIQIDDDAAFPEWKKYSMGLYDANQDGTILAVEGRLRSDDDPMAQLERSDIFVLDRTSNKIKKISIGALSQVAHEPSLSGDGRYVVFAFRGLSVKREDRGVIVFDNNTNDWKKIFKGSSYSPRISSDGRWIAFETTVRRSPSRPDSIDIYLLPNPFASQ